MMLYVDLLMALSRSIDLVDPYIGSHNKRVAYISGRLAHSLGLQSSDITKIVVAAALHDIGVLKESEYKELIDLRYKGGIDYHSIVGYRLLDTCEITKGIAPIIKFHHVYYSDKNNYNEVEIPLASEIIHLADRVDVSINYKQDLLSQKNSICSMIQEHSGEQFNPEIVKCFLSLAEQESFWFDLQFNKVEKKIKYYIFYNAPLTLEQIHSIAMLFTKIIDFRSRFTATHSSSVARISRELGRLCNMSERECNMLDIAGHMHDLGKLAIPLSILEKPDKLTPDEWRIMKQHTYFTYQLIDEIESPLFKVINEWASFHHESINGKGYPFKISGNMLTIGSKILAVADMFTALAESRPYRTALNDDEIISILQNAKDSALDGKVVDTLLCNYDYLKQIRTESFCNSLKDFSLLFDNI